MSEKWFKSVGRNAPILIWSGDIYVYKEGIKVDELEWSVHPSLVIRNGTPLTYEFESTQKHVWTNLGEIMKTINPALDQVLQKIEEEVGRNLKLHPVNAIVECRSLYDTLERSGGIMLMGFYLTTQVYERIKEVAPPDFFEQIKDHISQPYKKTMPSREQAAVEALQLRFRSGAVSSEELKHECEILAQEYGFMHAEYIGKDHTAEDYAKEVKNTHIVASNEVDAIEISDPYIAWLTKVAGQWAYIFDEAKIAFIRSMWCIRKTARSLGLDDLTLVNLTRDEFLKWIDTGKLPDGNVIERSRYYVSLLKDNVITEVFDKDAVTQIIQDEGITEFEEISREIKELKGIIAYRGLVRGKARITLTQEDAKHVQDGDILVASMTTTELLSAMKRAAAFVTDEGGVTCHAAIVAREFKKPCIIGTQIATRVVRDGDTIEVDAHKGVVRIIN